MKNWFVKLVNVSFLKPQWENTAAVKGENTASEFAFLIPFLPAVLASKSQVKTWQINHH